MKKRLFLLKILLFSSIQSFSQVGINTDIPDSSSVLDVVSTNKGVLFPRLALESLTDMKTIENPAEGLLIFNTNSDLSFGKGYYYFMDGKWEPFVSKISKDYNKVYHFVDHKETTKDVLLDGSLIEIEELSTTYSAKANGILFLNYSLYATMPSGGVFGFIQFKDLETEEIQEGTALLYGIAASTNSWGSTISTSTIKPVNIIKGHNYSIKLFMREAHSSGYSVKAGSVSYLDYKADSILTISSLTDPE